MINITPIEVKWHETWGDIHSIEAVLPRDVKKITAVWANAIPDEGSFLKRYIDGVEGVGDRIGVQIGNISASLNHTEILIDSSPLCVLSAQEKSNLNSNRIELNDGGITVERGTILRVIIEETEDCPFVSSAEEFANYPEHAKWGDKKLKNTYTAKLYIEYER